jgi:hypothetical protein
MPCDGIWKRRRGWEVVVAGGTSWSERQEGRREEKGEDIWREADISMQGKHQNLFPHNKLQDDITTSLDSHSRKRSVLNILSDCYSFLLADD